MERLFDGSRKITGIHEVKGIVDDAVTLSQIIAFRQTGVEEGKIVGEFVPTNIPPSDALLRRVTSWPVPDELQQQIKILFTMEE